MPKYFNFKIAGYYLYFTSFCIVECVHAHASDLKLTEAGPAKFFIKENGDTVVQNKGILTERELKKIQSLPLIMISAIQGILIIDINKFLSYLLC
jgi:hypothetical protein